MSQPESVTFEAPSFAPRKGKRITALLQELSRPGNRNRWALLGTYPKHGMAHQVRARYTKRFPGLEVRGEKQEDGQVKVFARIV